MTTPLCHTCCASTLEMTSTFPMLFMLLDYVTSTAVVSTCLCQQLIAFNCAQCPVATLIIGVSLAFAAHLIGKHKSDGAGERSTH